MNAMTRIPAAGVLLFAIAIVAAPGCGPSDSGSGSGSRAVYFFLEDDAESDIRTLQFSATPTAGSFVGSDGGCVFGVAAGPLDPDDDILSVSATGELQVKKKNAANDLGPEAVVVTCRLADDGIEPVLLIDTINCQLASDTEPSDDPDADCPMDFTLETLPECGNNVVETGEQCDEDNGNTKPCLPDCTDATCGDAKVCSDADCDTTDSGDPEECDDGNQVDTDSCTNDCANKPAAAPVAGRPW